MNFLHQNIPKSFTLIALDILDEDVGFDLSIGLEEMLLLTFLAFPMTLYHTKNTKHKYERKQQTKLVNNKHIQVKNIIFEQIIMHINNSKAS